MDFYSMSSQTLRRPEIKRQSPCTQVFKSQSSNPANQPKSEMNLSTNDISTHNQSKPVNFAPQTSQMPNPLPNNNFYSPPQTNHNLFSTESTPLDSNTMQVEEEDDDDAPPCEVITKKVKTAMFTTFETKFARKVSSEEEKEESDPSTTCDARSDFNTSNEAADFMISPSMIYQHSKDPSEIKLDNEDESLKLGGMSPNSSTDEANLKYAQEMAQQMPDFNDDQTLSFGQEPKFKCHLNHQIGVNNGSNPRKGCARCEALLEECREFARKNGGRCTNDEYEETIRYQCQKGHCWTLNHKNARRRWCAQCAKEQRQFLKKKCEEEKVEREKQEEECQKKLFEEAKKKAAASSVGSESNKIPFNFGGMNTNSGQKGMTALEYFQRMDYEIETLAKKYTIEFMSQKNFTGEISHQQILQVYKIMIMPEQVLQCYMFNLSGDTLKAEFRRMAKMIHPDKNKHPQAGNAFQKIYKVYEVALSRQEGTQQKT